MAYSDFGWPEQRTVGEFDGKVKYGRLLKPGQDPGDAVFEEKLREDAFRARGWEVVRWTWTDLRDFRATAARIRVASAGSPAAQTKAGPCTDQVLCTSPNPGCEP